jgi:hypothetical protein
MIRSCRCGDVSTRRDNRDEEKVEDISRERTRADKFRNRQGACEQWTGRQRVREMPLKRKLEKYLRRGKQTRGQGMNDITVPAVKTRLL